MKKLATAALLLVGALALAGCTASPEPAPEAAQASPAAAQQVADAEPTPTPTPTAPVSVEAAKSEAIASGRPEAAWDKNCVAWELPAADTEGQAWANKRAAKWLSSHDAGCPDAIVYPYYFVESFTAGAEGELIVTAEADLQRVISVHVDGSSVELINIAQNVFDELEGTSAAVEKVTTKLPGTDFTQTASRTSK